MVVHWRVMTVRRLAPVAPGASVASVAPNRRHTRHRFHRRNAVHRIHTFYSMRPFTPALGQCPLQLLDVAESRENNNGDDCKGRNGAANGNADAFFALLFGWFSKDRLSGGKYC